MLTYLGTTWNEGLELGLRTQPLRVRLPHQVQVKVLHFVVASNQVRELKVTGSISLTYKWMI